jgi:hypothetical protein
MARRRTIELQVRVPRKGGYERRPEESVTDLEKPCPGILHFPFPGTISLLTILSAALK